MDVELWPIDKPIPYARNARKLSDRAVDTVVASLKEFGFRQPLVVDRDGVIVVGHTRLLAAKKLGLSQIPVHVASNLTPGQIKAYRLMDNRAAQETSWDLDLLGPELTDLKSLNFDLHLTGFGTHELDELLLGDLTGDSKEDQAPNLPEHPVTRLGDLWLMGSHRVLCGDSTTSDATSRLCGATRPVLMATDPPYGVSYDPAWRIEVDGGGRHAVGKVQNDDRVDWSPAFRLFGGHICYIWHAGVHAAEVAVSLLSVDFQIRAQIIWRKQHFVMSRGAYHWGHEPCWYAVRRGKRSNWLGDRTQSTVWEVKNLNPHGGNKDEKQTGHGTQKPVELMRRPILNHTERADVVYDPFLGSGTTVIAAEQTERTCYALDIDPKYVDVAVLRWQQQTGKQATLDGDGRTFEQVAVERAGVIA